MANASALLDFLEKKLFARYPNQKLTADNIGAYVEELSGYEFDVVKDAAVRAWKASPDFLPTSQRIARECQDVIFELYGILPAELAWLDYQVNRYTYCDYGISESVRPYPNPFVRAAACDDKAKFIRTYNALLDQVRLRMTGPADVIENILMSNHLPMLAESATDEIRS